MAGKNAKIKFHVISHTHWDREWCIPFEVTRIRLVDMIDNLLDILDEYPAYKFHLDAQSITLEDYLEIRPHRRAVLEKHIRSGRIMVGPWYVQNDFYLTSGEATVRNLLIGADIAREFGKCSMIGYAPDQFGIIAQLPQIFRRFGIDNCIFGRGAPIRALRIPEFIWRSEDGSEVVTHNMRYWYNNAQRFSADIGRAVKLVDSLRPRMAAASATGNYMLMNGVDILEAQENLLPILDEVDKRLPEGETIFQSTMDDYIDELRKVSGSLETVSGEMRYGRETMILAGTLSSRVYLKQDNAYTQNLIEKRIEPLYSFIEMCGAPEFPADELRYMWKTLIKNHPHDDICGCSVDSVHEQMVYRFKLVRQAGQEMLERAMSFISAYTDRKGLTDEDYLMTVYNTNTAPGGGVLVREIDFPASVIIGAFTVRDDAGNPVRFEVLGKRSKTKAAMTPINLPGMLDYTSYLTAINIDEIPGMGYRTYTVTPADQQAAADQKRLREPVLENDHLRAQVMPDGTLTILDKKTGTEYRGLLELEDTTDGGDSYLYSSPADLPPVYSAGKVKAKIFEYPNPGSLIQKISYRYQLAVPAAFRSSVKVRLPVTVTLALNHDGRALDVTMEVDNLAEDHRLRVLFPTGIASPFTQAGSPYDVAVRDRRLIDDGILTVKQQPNTGFVNIDGEGSGFTILNRGLYEYEHLGGDFGTIALTLLRCTGVISGGASGIPTEENWRVPGCQSPGRHTFEMSLYPHEGDWRSAGVVHMSDAFTNPLFSWYAPVKTEKFLGGRMFVQDAEISEFFTRPPKYPELSMPASRAFIEVSRPEMALTCLKKAEKIDALVVRLYNSTSEAFRFDMKLGACAKRAYKADLAENETGKLSLSDGGRTVKEIEAAPKEIVTIMIVAGV